MLIKNKRGDVSVVLLVLLVLVVTGASVFSFITNSGKVSSKISGAGVVEGVYLEENLIEFYLNEAGKRAVVVSYNELINSEEYVENPVVNFRNEVRFGNLHPNLNENLKTKFSKNLKTEFLAYEFKEDYLINLKQSILDEEFSVALSKGVFRLSVSGQELDNVLENNSITYFPEISLDFNLNEIGLDSFERVHATKEFCKDKASKNLIENCFNEKLKGFTSLVEEKTAVSSNNYTFVALTSKKEFLINEQFKNIKFGFIPD